jgi:MFS family permease
MLMTSFFMVLIPLIISKTFSGDSIAFGLANSAFAAGAMISALFLLPLLNKHIPKFTICTIGALIAGIGLVASSLSSSIITFILLIPSIGCGISILTMNGMSHRILAFPKDSLARLAAIDISIGNIARSFGLGLTAFLLNWIDAQLIGAIYGVLIIFLSLALLLIPGWKEFMSLNHDELEGYFEQKYSV